MKAGHLKYDRLETTQAKGCTKQLLIEKIANIPSIMRTMHALFTEFFQGLFFRNHKQLLLLNL